jgi:hypothetical protein
MGDQSYAPGYFGTSSPEYSSSDMGATDLGATAQSALRMDPADVFNYLQQNRQRIGLSDQFQAYNDGDAYVVRMSRDDVQHLTDTLAGFANAYMTMAQRNPQLLQAMNGQQLLMGSVGESGCPCGGGCQCCGGCNGSWNQGNDTNQGNGTINDSIQPPAYVTQPQDFPEQADTDCSYAPGYDGNNGCNTNSGSNDSNPNSGYNENSPNSGYNGYGWNRYNTSCGGGSPIIQSIASGGGRLGGYGGYGGYGGNPQQILRNVGANVVSNLIFSGLGGGFGRFHR